MRAADEFVGPVGYSGPLTWLPIALVACVIAYYVWALTHREPVEEDSDHRPFKNPVDTAKAKRLADIDRIDNAVRLGRMPVRIAFQQLSVALRGFVGDVTGLPARSMTAGELREATDSRVADAIEAMYTPEFAPDDALAEDFERSVRGARELVRTWT
ncbi:hypothetical protein [Nocardioides cavernaquae]|uniref:DUF4129 domain-containing protein n=1 Tax=Nocardioides cavernaquae TaxID=2321396 RepID=A0A3A5HA51_9ACTN|nr:hypothetical protein [Nocardioides cavernaquae]RJS44914.1 hypothetical protein D4739_00745 [Nocardioides cavernaquae]